MGVAWWWALVVAVAVPVVGEDAPAECPCGLGEAPWPKGGAKSSDVKWFHVPKVGASWALSMVRAQKACDGVALKGLAASMKRGAASGSLAIADARAATFRGSSVLFLSRGRSCEGKVQAECLLEALRRRSPTCRAAVAGSLVGHAPLPRGGDPRGGARHVGLFREPSARLASVAAHAAEFGSLRGAKRQVRREIFGRAPNTTLAREPRPRIRERMSEYSSRDLRRPAAGGARDEARAARVRGADARREPLRQRVDRRRWRRRRGRGAGPRDALRRGGTRAIQRHFNVRTHLVQRI